MPLKAFINGLDGRKIIAPLLTDHEWADLKAKHRIVTMGCCGKRGFFKVTRQKTKHFAHDANTGCDWERETPEHLLAKTEIVQACVANGWHDSDVEVKLGDGVRADVLAQRTGAKKVAFEIQWSCQSIARTEQRQGALDRGGARACWLFHKPPTLKPEIDLNRYGHRDDRSPSEALPIFRISKEPDGNLRAWANSTPLPLCDFTKLLLNGHFKFRERIEVVDGRVSVAFVISRCTQCLKPTRVFYAFLTYLSPCGVIFGPENGGLWLRKELSNFDLNNEIHRLADEVINSQPQLRLLSSNTFVELEPMIWSLSEACEWCSTSLTTDLKRLPFTPKESRLRAISEVLSSRMKLFEPLNLACEHWCFSANKGFCRDAEIALLV